MTQKYYHRSNKTLMYKQTDKRLKDIKIFIPLGIINLYYSLKVSICRVRPTSKWQLKMRQQKWKWRWAKILRIHRVFALTTISLISFMVLEYLYSLYVVSWLIAKTRESVYICLYWRKFERRGGDKIKFRGFLNSDALL